MRKELLDKYNIPVPRYTSYPPANHFKEYTEEMYRHSVSVSNRATDRNISFYLHMPYCKHLCHYCGCNSYAMAQPQTVRAYVNALHREIDLLLPLLDKDRRIAQIHYGGGSPTALPVALLRELNEHLLSAFDTIEQPEIAIECHPGYLTTEDWEELTKSHFNRFSIGVQDLNPQVLKTVNRRPSLLPLEEIFRLLRQSGVAINVDLLYGLPHQTPESFAETVEKIIALHPDRLVTFGYAHVPWVNKQQTILEKAGLPTSETRNAIFTRAKALLHEAGYRSVGIDHFVRPEDELYTAQEAHRLHRNFQGYCTRRTTAQVYAFGVTGIGQLETAYIQHTKDIDAYIQTTEKGDFGVTKGYDLSIDEQWMREVVESLLCNYRISWEDLAKRLGTDKATLKTVTNYDTHRLDAFMQDGLLTYDDNLLAVTEEGKAFVRNIAALLDPLMQNTTLAFSKPV